MSRPDSNQNNIGLTTAHHHPQSQSAFVTGLTSSNYNPFLVRLGTQLSPPFMSRTNLQIRCAAALNEIVYFVDSNNRISAADMVDRRITPIPRSEQVQNDLKRGEQIMAVGVTEQRHFRGLCKRGQQLRFLDIALDNLAEPVILREIVN